MEDSVFRYLEEICQNEDLITEHENIFKEIMENITTGQDIKYDFVAMFTYAIFWQQSTLRVAELVENEFLPKMKKEKCSYSNFPNNLLTWVEVELNFKSDTTKKVLKGVSKFIDFVGSIEKTIIKSPIEFKKALERYYKKSINDIKDGMILFPQMGEKTAGLFLKTVGYYSNLRNLEKWKEYKYPTFGIAEIYIQRFIKDMYEYYGNLAYEKGLFSEFILKTPISLDIIRAAYVEGYTFKKFLKK